jgi:hypothetical protein
MREPVHKLDWEQIQSVMGGALDLTEEQRAAYLERQPPSIRAEVESLLAAWRRSTRVFGPETGTQEPASPVSGPVSIDAGTQLGPYRIETLIGHGGMGAIYRALDRRLNRLVAIKFLFNDGGFGCPPAVPAGGADGFLAQPSAHSHCSRRR